MSRSAARSSVTVVLPTRNRADLLGRAIRSVLDQTHEHWELVIVDDDSTDGTDALVRSFTDRRIRYLRSEGSAGPSRARNTGIRAAGPTEFLAFLDDDDEWLSRKLERQLEVFQTSPLSPVAVGCGRIDCGTDGEKVLLPHHRGFIFEDLLARRARGYGAPLVMVRRIPGEPDFVFDEELPCLEDADYGMRIARNRAMDFVAEPLVKVYRDERREHAWNAEAALRGYDLLALKYADELARRPWVRSYYAVCAARELSSLGRMAECRRRLRDAMPASESRARLVAWYCGSLLGRVGQRVAERLLPVAPPETRFPAAAVGLMPV